MSAQLQKMAPVAPGLAELRRTSQAQFNQFTEVLGEVHGALTGIEADVARLNALLEDVGQARHDVGKVRLACVALAHHLAQSHAAITSDSLPPAMANGMEATRAMGLECRQLRAIASMTRVAGCAANIDGVETYIANLRAMIQRLEETSGVMQDGLRSISTAVQDASSYLNHASICARDALAQRTVADADTRGDPQDLSAVTGALIARLGASIRNNTGILMNGIQFSDAFAQRLEHVVEILDAARGRSGPRVLASAQLAALCADAETLLATTRAALQNLGADGQSAAQALSGDIGGRAAEVLADWRAELDDGQTLDRLVTPALRSAVTTVATIDTAMSVSARDLATLSDTALEVRLAAVNARLLAGRAGGGKTAMALLSGTVQEKAQICSGLNQRCRDSFESISALMEQAGFTQLAQQSEGLSRHIEQAHADLTRVADLFSELERLKNAAGNGAVKLQEALDRGLALLSALPGLITDIASHVGPDMPSGLNMAQRAELEEFANCYTMEREREIHAEVTGTELLRGDQAEQTVEDIFF